jgi:hypothetical protein
MKWIAIAFGLAALTPAVLPAAPAPAGTGTITGPKVLLIGDMGPGAVRATGYLAAGFVGGPVVDVHSVSPGVRVRDVQVGAGAANGVPFTFEVDYDGNSSINMFTLEIIVSGGSGNTKDGVEKYGVVVKKL